MSAGSQHAEHFASLEQQADAARLGMWVFLASEALLFAGLFALYAALRFEYPEGFRDGVRHMAIVLGSANTGVLLTSSLFVALATGAAEEGSRKRAAVLFALGASLGVVFLVLKLTEYAHHFREGLVPGAHSALLVSSGTPAGFASFVTLYYVMTGIHAIHVSIGILVLLIFAARLLRAPHGPEPSPHAVELAALYWHLVDVVWIFLWPLFYLTHGG